MQLTTYLIIFLLPVQQNIDSYTHIESDTITEIERDSERETERERQGDRQTDTHTHTHTHTRTRTHIYRILMELK